MKNQAKALGIKAKTFRPEVKVLNAENGSFSAVVSDEMPDRDGDVVMVNGWQLDYFNQHPVMLSSHDYFSLRNIIGEWTSLEVKGKKLIGNGQLYIGEGNEEADWAWKLVSKGMAAFSVGFMPLEYELVDKDNGNDWFGPFKFTSVELLEISMVSIPANPRALQLGLKKGIHNDPVIAEILRELAPELGVEPLKKTQKQTELTLSLTPELRDYIQEQVKSSIEYVTASLEFAEQKKGRVLSSKNESLLKSAMSEINSAAEKLNQVLSSLNDDGGDDSDDSKDDDEKAIDAGVETKTDVSLEDIKDEDEFFARLGQMLEETV